MDRRLILKALTGFAILPSLPVGAKPQYDLLADIADIICRDIKKHGETSIYRIGCNPSGFAYLYRTGHLTAQPGGGEWKLCLRAKGCGGCLGCRSLILSPFRPEILILRQCDRRNPYGRIVIVETRCFNVDYTQEGVVLNA